MTEPKYIAIAITRLVKIDLGRYAGAFSVDKYFHLLNAILNLKSHIIVNYGEDSLEKEFNEKLESLKTKQIYKKIKSYKNMNELIEKLQPDIFNLRFKYDDIRDKHLKGKKDDGKEENLRKFSKKVSPYLVELFFIFNFLMMKSGFQNQTIEREYLRNPDLNPQSRSLEEKKAEDKERKKE